jgi:hypothetical protein
MIVCLLESRPALAARAATVLPAPTFAAHHAERPLLNHPVDPRDSFLVSGRGEQQEERLRARQIALAGRRRQLQVA